MTDWVRDDHALEAAAKIAERVLASGIPATSDELSRAGLPIELGTADQFPASFDWAAAAYQRSPEFAYPQERWQDIFQGAGWTEAVQVARTMGGVVAYHILDGEEVRLIGIIDEQTTIAMKSPEEGARAGRQWSSGDSHDLYRVLKEFWDQTLTRWRERYPAGSTVRAICIDIGEGPPIAYLTDWIFQEVLITLGLPEDSQTAGLSHLPSIRLAATRAGRPLPPPPQRLLHIGDATQTLIGPWLEIAGMAALPHHLETKSLPGGGLSPADFREWVGWAPVIVASCHGGIDTADLLGSALGIGRRGLKMKDLAATDLTGVDLLFLGSCETSVTRTHSHEREALSVANAALVAGSRFVAAPKVPVDDLVSAVIVVEFAAQLVTASPPLAYHLALATVRNLCRAEFTERASTMWDALRASEIAERMPWPVEALEPVIRSRIEAAGDQGAWQKINYVLSGA